MKLFAQNNLNSYHVGEIIPIEMSFDAVKNIEFVLSVRSCYATNAMNASAPRYYLLDKGYKNTIIVEFINDHRGG